MSKMQDSPLQRFDMSVSCSIVVDNIMIGRFMSKQSTCTEALVDSALPRSHQQR